MSSNDKFLDAEDLRDIARLPRAAIRDPELFCSTVRQDADGKGTALLLKKGANVNCCHPITGNSALIIASFRGFPEV
jgi:hypothetical protein